jgi:hypothetical protein
MDRRRFAHLSAVLLAACLLLAALPVANRAEAPDTAKSYADPLPLAAGYYATPNLRFGIGSNKKTKVMKDGVQRSAQITDYDVDPFHFGWYSNWDTEISPPLPEGMRFVQLLRVRPTLYPTNTLQITDTVTANPGALWIIGNEPEAKYNQGKRSPAEYAEIYHDMYMLIKGTAANPGLDRSAWIAIGGVIQPTPVRLQWLDEVLTEYQTRYGEAMPVDVWNIHVQILQEKGATISDPIPWGAEVPVGIDVPAGRLYTLIDNGDPEIFKQLVIEFRQWMKQKGFRNKPLIISEYGVLMPASYIVEDGDPVEGENKAIAFMYDSFDWMLETRDTELGYAGDDYHLVQQWMWFSLNSAVNGALFSNIDPTVMTNYGVAFRTYMWRLLGLLRAASLPVVSKSQTGR